MKELLRTNDLVKLSWLQALLSERGIESVVLDGDTAAGYGGALIERRLMVLEEDFDVAERAFRQAEQEL